MWCFPGFPDVQPSAVHTAAHDAELLRGRGRLRCLSHRAENPGGVKASEAFVPSGR